MEIKRIQPSSSLNECDIENDNIDVNVELTDGRTYSFLVATPNNIYWCMQNEQIDYFFGVPPVFVRELTLENMERALRALFADNDGIAVATYGMLQEKQ